MIKYQEVSCTHFTGTGGAYYLKERWDKAFWKALSCLNWKQVFKLEAINCFNHSVIYVP